MRNGPFSASFAFFNAQPRFSVVLPIARQLRKIQHIQDEFRIIAQTVLIETTAIWVYVSMNLLWTVVVYPGFLLSTSLIYGTNDYYERHAEVVEGAQ